MKRLVPVLLLLGACGVSEEKFQEQYAEKACTLTMECSADESGGFFFDSQEECESFFALALSLGTDGCDYDKKAAKDCLNALDEATCDNAGDELESTCAEVYTGDECGMSGGDTGWDSGR